MKFSVWNMLLVLFAVAAVGVVVYAFWPKPLAVDTAEVRRGPMQVTVDEDGKTRIKERYIVSAPLGGRLARIQLQAGGPIEAGDTLEEQTAAFSRAAERSAETGKPVLVVFSR